MAPRQALILEYPLGRVRQQIVAGDVYQEGFGPLRLSQFAVWTGNGIDCGGVHDDVDSAELRES